MALACSSSEVAATQSLSVMTFVAILVASAHGRLDAAVGEEAAQDDRRDSLAAQDEVEIRAGEGVESALAFDDDIAFLGIEFLRYRRAPGALDGGVAVDDALEDAVGVRADLVVSLREHDWRMHDGHPSGPSGLGDTLSVREHARLLHDALDGSVQHVPLT